jgi:hypothetical protein
MVKLTLCHANYAINLVSLVENGSNPADLLAGSTYVFRFSGGNGENRLAFLLVNQNVENTVPEDFCRVVQCT